LLFVLLTYSLSLVLYLSFFSSTPLLPVLYSLSLHDALPIYSFSQSLFFLETSLFDSSDQQLVGGANQLNHMPIQHVLSSIRSHIGYASVILHSSHVSMSYAVFCFKNNIHL